ncbi:hypothetical protein L9F63_022059 [Diploptera punctata]|uniref:VTT domain-containing protein n=1 Tax=Diploptera punctata TaxID=6984 RepID=A0AAD8EB62_DIPPU|nr:hypothetical protein L9F63_022059 [Diploptera punctata]
MTCGFQEDGSACSFKNLENTYKETFKTMSINTSEGELIIQSPEITSTVSYKRCSINHNFRRRRSVYQNPNPLLWNSNQEPLFPRPNLNVVLSPEFNGPGNGVRVYNSSAQLKTEKEGSTRRAVLIVAVIFFTSLLALGYIYMMFPDLEPHELQYVKFPWDIEDAKQLGTVLAHYKDKYFFEVLLGIIIIYIFLQTFAIPGSISLSILSGYLFSFPIALTLICFCSATGASLCYILSHFLGRRLVNKYFPHKVSEWSITVNKHRENLLNYIIFLRVTPFLPNWFINIASPIIDVPLFKFWLGTFIGVAPPSFIAIQTGKTLQTLSSSSSSWSWTSVIMLVAFAVISLLPVMFRRKFKEAIE